MVVQIKGLQFYKPVKNATSYIWQYQENCGLIKDLAVARKIYDRHRLLTDFLVSLGVDRDTASADACKIEHHISDASFEAIKRAIEK